MRIYVVEPSPPFFDWGKRIGDLHNTVFYGRADYPTLVEWEPQSGINEKGERCGVSRPPEWQWPAVTNDNREPLHISRSGRFVPAVFGTFFDHLVVSGEVREALASLPHVGFNDVVFEQLVDLPMPKLADFSWYDREDIDDYDCLPNNYLLSLPHVPEFEKTIGPYYQLLPANFQDLAGPKLRWVQEGELYRFLPPEPPDDPEKYADVQSLAVNFGTYQSLSSPTHVRVSRTMLEEYPIIQEPHFVFREDAFAKIAPFLDLEYYAIAVLTLDDPESDIDD